MGDHLRRAIRHKDLRIWDTLVAPCLASYRFSGHATNGHSPFFAMHGYDPTLPLDTLLRPRRKYLGSDHSQIYLENLHRAFLDMAKRSRDSRSQNRKRHNKKVTQHNSFEVGDAVYYHKGRKSKLDHSWEPHYRVVKVRGPVSYAIRHGITGQIIVFDLLRLC